MAADGTITLSTKIDDSGIESGMSKMKSGAAKLGKAFAVVGAAATTAFTAISKSAVESYAEHEQLVGGVETLFKTSSDVVMNYANQAYETAGMSANMYMETVTGFSASLLQSLGGDTAKAAEYGNQAVIDMSDNANKMGTDMQRIQDAYQGFAKQNYTMLDNLKLGYGGTKEEMERLLADAEKIKAANGEMASYSVDSFADIVEAIHVVQENMGIAGTTAEEASTTIQGSINMMKGAWQNLLTGLADTNADVEDLMEKLVDSVETAFDNLKPVIEETLNNLPKLVTNLGTKIIKAIPSVFAETMPVILDSVSTLIQEIVNTVSKNADTIADTIIDIGKTLANTIVALVPQMVSAGGQLIQALAKGMSAQMPVLSTVATTITSVFSAIKVVDIAHKIVLNFTMINNILTLFQSVVAGCEAEAALLIGELTPLQLAVGVLTGKIKLATVAQAAWNAIKALDPTILMVTAVVALTAAVVGSIFAYNSYIEKNSEMIQASKAFAEAAEESAERVNDFSESLSSLNETATQTIEKAEAEAYVNSALADELYDLADKTNLTVQEKSRMNDIVEELNGNINGLNLQLDEETGQLNMARDALNEYISKSLETAKAKAVMELYTETLKEQYKVQGNMVEVTNRLSQEEAELDSILKNVEVSKMGIRLTTMEEEKAIENLEAAIAQDKNTLKQYETEMDEASAHMQIMADIAGVTLPSDFAKAETSAGNFFSFVKTEAQNSGVVGTQGGRWFVNGYVNAINAGQGPVKVAVGNLVQAALNSMMWTQRSASPSKKTFKIGEYFVEGYLIGIESGFGDVKKAGADLAKSALKGAKKSTKEIRKTVTKLFKSLTEDTRTEVQKIMDDSNEELLESEIKYNEECARIEKEREEKEWQTKLDNAKTEEERQKIHNERMEKEQQEAEDAYLQGLKETADKEREIFEAQQKDVENLKKNIVNTFSEMAEEAFDKIEELEKTQESFAKKLSDYGGLYTEVETKAGWKRVVPADLEQQIIYLEDYYSTLEQLKDKGDIPKEFFEIIRDMGVEEGSKFASALLELPEDEFNKYIADWKRKQEISQNISKALYADEAEELKNEIMGEFEDVEKEFFEVGGTAAEYFGEGFLAEFMNIILITKKSILSAFSSVTIPVGTMISSGIATQSGGVTELHVPAMAKGGVVPRAMVSLLGENGREAVLPLERNTEWMDLLADKVAQRNGFYTQGNQVIREEHYHLGETELMTLVYKLAKAGQRINGGSFIDGGVL